MADTTEYAATFKLLDTDGDGRISPAELSQLLVALGGKADDEVVAQAFASLDTDNDGLVTEAELAAYLSH